MEFVEQPSPKYLFLSNVSKDLLIAIPFKSLKCSLVMLFAYFYVYLLGDLF